MVLTGANCEALCHVGSPVSMADQQNSIRITKFIRDGIEELRVVGGEVVHVACLTGAHMVMASVRIGGTHREWHRGMAVLLVAMR